MKNYLKRSICFILAAIMTLSLSACSAGTEITQENITKTIQKVEKALREFDTDTLEKYVSSKTLDYIIKFAGSHEQMANVGKLMFEKLELSVVSVDTEAATAKVAVKNKDMAVIGERYVKMLKTRSHGDTMEMLNLMSDEEFLDISERSLTAQISRATVPDNPTEITLGIKRGKKNLVLVFGEEAENAVSGGVVNSVKDNFSLGFGGVTVTAKKQN